MQVRQVTLQAPATNTTQNYTVAGFGTPQAAIIMSSWSADSSWQNGANICLGFWDGSNQNVMGAGWQNGGTPGQNDGRQFSDSSNVVWAIVNGTSTNERLASITGTVDGGVTLTWTGNSPTTARPYVTVILIKGINGVQVGHRTATQTDTDTTQTTTTGITPKLILFAGRRGDSATGTGTDPGLYLGFAADNGVSIDEFSVGHRNRTIDPTDCNGRVDNDRCISLDVGITGLATQYLNVTAMASGSFTTTTTNPDTLFFSSQNYMALDFDEDVKAWAAATPTAAGDWDPATVSFTPQWAFMIPTGFVAINTAYSGGEDGVEAMHLYSVNADGDEDGHYITMENGSTGAGNMFGQSRYDNRLEVNEVTATPTSSALLNGNSPTFDASGIVYADANFSHDVGTAHQVIGFFVEEAAAAPAANMMTKMMHEGHVDG